MKRIIVIALFVFGLMSVLPTISSAQDSTPNFESTTKAYSVFFPIAPGEETARAARYLEKKDVQIHSYITAEYRSKELGHYIKYSVALEPLDKYKPYQDAVSEKIDELINFYDGKFDYRIPNISNYDKDDSWGKDITIEFYDNKIPKGERPESTKPWVIRRLVFYKDRHIFTLEALGSMEYIYSQTTRRFFNSITPSIGRVK